MRVRSFSADFLCAGRHLLSSFIGDATAISSFTLLLIQTLGYHSARTD